MKNCIKKYIHTEFSNYPDRQLKNKINEMFCTIDLNYILAEARKEKYKLSLTNGHILNNIKWENDECYLSYNYDICVRLISHYILNHFDKIIKLNISSDHDIYPLDRNMIIYIPEKIDIDKICKEYESVVIY